MEIDTLVLQGSPEVLDKDVVHPTPPTIHADTNLGLAQYAGEGLQRKLAALIRVEYLGLAVADQRLLQRRDAEASRRSQPQKPASIVFDSRQASTLRIAQSMIAARYRNPRRIGM